MKELSGTASNYYAIENDKGNFKAQAELIVVVSEPDWKVVINGLIRERISEHYRITMSQSGVKLLIKTLMEIEKELEVLNKKLSQISGQASQTSS